MNSTALDLLEFINIVWILLDSTFCILNYATHNLTNLFLKKVRTHKFTINATGPVNDRIFDINTFALFLNDRIKVEGRTHNFGSQIEILKDAVGKVTVVTHCRFSGRYLKYLTKKYLKKQNLRDWIRVTATDKGVYTLKFFNVVNDKDDKE